jgi:hypothetical protein
MKKRISLSDAAQVELTLQDPTNDPGADEGESAEPGVLVVKERPMRSRAGMWLGLVAILVAALGLWIRTGMTDWRGLDHELAGWGRRVAGLVGAGKAAEATKPEVPRSASDVATAKPEGVPIVAAPEPEPAAQTEAPVDEIARAAEAKNQELEELNRIKEKEAEALANAPQELPPHLRQRGLPPGVDAEAFMRQQMAMARARMAEMMREQARFFGEEDEAFARMRELMLRDLGAADPFAAPAPGRPNGPPLGGAPGVGFDPFADALREIQEFEKEATKRAKEWGAEAEQPEPGVKRFEWRGPDGSFRRVEIRTNRSA